MKRKNNGVHRDEKILSMDEEIQHGNNLIYPVHVYTYYMNTS